MSQAPEDHRRTISIADLFFFTAAIGAGLMVNCELTPEFRVWGSLGRQWALRISDFEQLAAPHLFTLTCALFFSYLWHHGGRGSPRPVTEIGWIVISATSLCLILKLGSIVILDATDSYYGEPSSVLPLTGRAILYVVVGVRAAVWLTGRDHAVRSARDLIGRYLAWGWVALGLLGYLGGPLRYFLK